MELTSEYLGAVDSLTIRCRDCDEEIMGTWSAQDGAAVLDLDPHVCRASDAPQTIA